MTAKSVDPSPGPWVDASAVQIFDNGDAGGFTAGDFAELPEAVLTFDIAADGSVTRLVIEAPNITTQGLRAIPVRRLHREAADWDAHKLVNLSAGAAMRGDLDLHAELRQLREAIDAAPRPGRRGRGDQFYAEIAAQYVRLLDSTDNPVAAMAGAIYKSPSQVRGLLREARDRDLLTAAPAGRAGGFLTPKAHSVLAEGKG